ncbi:6-phosphogluconolactonase [Candidatus Rhabdochlamydia porcellionis]|jgi:6-phosphogluconolactonase|uniref:6-phosphogluconolactonase n=1 Tax=Candidatus Rhabdochlamydia porcellionis TaxID=225148 RepID=A0ABX8Z0D2_9BACT|nr:6-phosphogluconolactonase [Candidatus Rhabdochlamydia porcellionis]QZA58760.1 6-phosphogluconolactonase [Candidatus Rhabdochlamydia porcellionis]
MLIETIKPRSVDESKNLIVPGNYQKTLTFCAEHFIALSKQALADHGFFAVALSGGSTPKAIFEKLCSFPYREQINWCNIHIFFSDERALPPDDPNNNFHMAMQAGFNKMPIPTEQIHRMEAEVNIKENALKYEETIHRVLGKRPFDLVMLGMGEDGHTASLFPLTEGLNITDRLCIANYVPQKKCWRMTLTFSCINQASNICIYVLGANKRDMLTQVLFHPSQKTFPVEQVGTPQSKALWIADEAAAVR